MCMNTLRHNPYACFFRSLKDISRLETYKIVLKTAPSQDQRVYNKPEVSQIAALWVDGDGNVENTHRNIEVKTHSNQSRKIDYYYGCYDPLRYPLMFPFGELGWQQGILKRGETQKRRSGKPDTTAACLIICPQNAENAENLLCMEEDVLAQKDDQSKFVSVREYYAYKLQIRNNDRSFLLQFGRLPQQYLVDNYVKLETQRLDFYRLQQSDIRREFPQGVVDAIGSGETDGSAVGQRIFYLLALLVAQET
ncbi:uncharacterized protein [Rutidosis leptorrhynchoides]|uniref:uncharacterized protein n=1 Tax=Rutidosis leptorrhynchoides TaxID=125765 RepID=UPI003A99EA05